MQRFWVHHYKKPNRNVTNKTKMKRSDNCGPFNFHRNIFNSEINTEKLKTRNCRQKLQDKFDNDDDCPTSEKNDRSVLSVLSLNDPRRVFRSGAEKIQRTISNMRTSIGTFSQKFRTVTKRRQLLEEGPSTPTCMTPQTRSKQILGRTPTKLYSPFGIESPAHFQDVIENKENIPKGSKIKKL